ncbi:MAG: hypothetical protein JWO08_2964 [Verrucomicrobiaceae bacterium]|nr:hypothetical protein [Verrucomicrobiaceae bacterium]
MDPAALPLTSPPPLPAYQAPAESGRHTYLRAVGLLFPCIVFLNFSALVMVLKLLHVWHDAGPEMSKAQWMLDASLWLPQHAFSIGPALACFFIALEYLVPGFAKRRSVVVTLVLIVFNAAVLATLTGIAVCALLAVPRLAPKPSPSAPAAETR